LPIFSKDGVYVLYIHVPKTGGTAIEDLFARNGFRTDYLARGDTPVLNAVYRCAPQHLHATQLEAIFNLPRFHYSFVTVRNPYARLISTFRMHHAEPKRPVKFNDWAVKTLARFAGDPFIFHNHIRPQVDFLLPGAEIFKFEQGYDEAWVGRLSAKIGLPFTAPRMQRVMVSQKEQSDLMMADDVKAMIGEVYAQDFARLGYGI